MPILAIVNCLSLIELKIRAQRRVTLVENDSFKFLNSKISVIFEKYSLKINLPFALYRKNILLPVIWTAYLYP